MNLLRKVASPFTGIIRNVAPKVGVVSVAAVGTGLATQAQAAVPAEVTTALTDAATDVGTIGAAVLLVAVAGYAIKWLMTMVVS